MLFRTNQLLEKIKSGKTPLAELKDDFYLILERSNDPTIRSVFTISDIHYFRYLASKKNGAWSRNSLLTQTVRMEDKLRSIRHRVVERRMMEQQTISHFSEAEALKTRMQELEEQLDKVKNSDELLESDTEEITLDSLKGKKILFGIMSFDPEFDDVWEGAIKRSAKNAGFFPLRIDMITKASDINDDIIEAIKKSDAIVVDVTKNNPNVMFELGYALGLKKSPIIISQSTDYLTFDIQNMRTIIYQNSWQGIEKLNGELIRFIKGTSKTKSKKK